MAHTGGPNKIMGKANLITGCEYRPCIRCGNRVFVPKQSKWRMCRPCREEWK